MKHTHIKDYLELLNVDWKSISLGDFDSIAEFTAKRERDVNSELYKTCGKFYRSNYERGILLYYLIRTLNITSMLEVGFGRGFSSFCAAKAFHDAGLTDGRIVSIEPQLNEQFVNALTQIFPKEWFDKIQILQGTSNQVLPSLQNQKFDLVLIDGDHSLEATKFDWLNAKNLCQKVIIFDDYHLASKTDPGIQCREAIDQIDFDKEGFDEPHLIKLDRRLFPDERSLTDDQIDYGQVVGIKKGLLCDW